MKIAQTYSHLNGEEYILVHHEDLYKEICRLIESIDADQCLTKESKEKTKKGNLLYSPVSLNQAFRENFNTQGWTESRYEYYVTTDRQLLPELLTLPYGKQKDFLISKGINAPIASFKQTDFVKDKIAIEVQFGKYAFVAYDLFVKHLLFYTGGVINLGIEILPTKKMQSRMSSGVAYYEGEIYNILRHGRNNPPVPLLILGIEPASL
ncbi:MAG: restriction endonuclease [Tannerella sp.]|jgi:hypothetical protein|nr:restriction endonuclease [Tannerella sp.]